MRSRQNRAPVLSFIILVALFSSFFSGCSSDLLNPIAEDVQAARTAHLWRGNRQIASTATPDCVGTVSVVGEDVYICYRRDHLFSTTRLYVARSSDDCETFTGTADGDYVHESASNIFYSQPHVVASTDGSHVYLSAFADSATAATGDAILFWRSQDGGETWSAPVTLASAAGTNNDYYQPHIMIRRVGADDFVYVTTYIERDAQINYRRSVNSGSTWESVSSSSTGGHASRSMSVALDPAGNVRNAFYYNPAFQPRIYSGSVVVYDIGGMGDPPAEYTAIAAGGTDTFYVAVSIDSGAVDGGLSVFKSTDDGANWGTREGIDPDGRIDCSIAVDGPNVYISYYDSADESLMLAKSTNSGGSFTIYPVDTDSDANTTMGKASSIAVKGNSVYINYFKSEGTSGYLMLAVSRDGGETW